MVAVCDLYLEQLSFPLFFFLCLSRSLCLSLSFSPSLSRSRSLASLVSYRVTRLSKQHSLRAICTVLLDPRDPLLQSERTQGFAADPDYWKGEVFAYVGLPQDLKDLKGQCVSVREYPLYYRNFGERAFRSSRL